jgi:hypothetical protein
MHSSMIGNIEKAARYSQEQQRFHFNQFTVTLDGDHRQHIVSYNQGEWVCDGETVDDPSFHPHIMAVERVLGEMLPTE